MSADGDTKPASASPGDVISVGRLPGAKTVAAAGRGVTLGVRWDHGRKPNHQAAVNASPSNPNSPAKPTNRGTNFRPLRRRRATDGTASSTTVILSYPPRSLANFTNCATASFGLLLRSASRISLFLTRSVSPSLQARI